MLDKNKDGRLIYDELKSGFNPVFGKYFTEIQMDKIIADIDADCD
jgi:Ca2+-binding EF-hand superfamily protein